MRLALFLTCTSMVIGISPLIGESPYSIDVINVFSRKAQKSLPPPYKNNEENDSLHHEPEREPNSLPEHLIAFSLEVVCPKLELSNQYLTKFLQTQPLNDPLIVLEQNLNAPRGDVVYGPSEPDWRIPPVYKEIEMFDFLHDWDFVAGEETPNYLEKFQFGANLVEMSSRYRESLMSEDYFQLGTSPLPTNFSHLVQSSIANLDHEILQSIALGKTLSNPDLSLETIGALSQLEKLSLDPLASFFPIVLPPKGQSFGVLFDANHSLAESFIDFESLQQENLISKEIEHTLWGEDLITSLLDINTSKASKELFMGSYLASDLRNRLILILDGEISRDCLKNSSKFVAFLGATLLDSTSTGLTIFVYEDTHTLPLKPTFISPLSSNRLLNSIQTTKLAIKIDTTTYQKKDLWIFEENHGHLTLSKNPAIVNLSLASPESSSKQANQLALSDVEEPSFIVSRYSGKKRDVSHKSPTHSIQGFPHISFPGSSHKIALASIPTPITHHFPKSQKAHWALGMTYELTTLTVLPFKELPFQTPDIQIASVKAPLFSGVTRPVFDHSCISQLSFSNLRFGKTEIAKSSSTAPSQMPIFLMFEDTSPYIPDKTLVLDLSNNQKKDVQQALFATQFNLAPTTVALPQNESLRPILVSSVLTMSQTLDLPNLPIKTTITNSLSMGDNLQFSLSTEAVYLSMKKMSLSTCSIDLSSPHLSHHSVVLYGSILSNNSLKTLTAFEDFDSSPPPIKVSMGQKDSFDKGTFPLVKTEPITFTDAQLLNVELYTAAIPDIKFITNDFSQSLTFTAPVVDTPVFVMDLSKRFQNIYDPLVLIGETPYELTYSFGTSAVNTNRANRVTHLLLASIPTLDDLNTDNLDEDFACEVKVAPHMSEDGYIFSARFTPQDKDTIEALPHHVIYLVDRGSSIESHRFDTFKSAIVKSLYQLHDNANVNIWLFDQQIDVLNSRDLRNTKTSINLLKQQLAKVKQGRRSSFSTLVQALNLLNKKAAESEELYTVVLLTNGSMMKNIRLHRESLIELVQTDPSTLSLYTAAVSDNNNLGMLELLAHIGHGELLHAKTHASFPRKFAQFMKKISRPLATGTHVSCFSENENTSLKHVNHLSSQLYADRSFTVHGSTSTLSNIDIIVQAERDGRYINIHKKINLEKGTVSRSYTEKAYYSRKALSEMIEFVFSNDQTHLIRAKELLAPYGDTLASR